MARRAGFETAADQTLALGLEQRPAFEDDGSIPSLFWSEWLSDSVFVLLVEDRARPVPDPLVHLLIWDLPPKSQTLQEGQFVSPRHKVGTRTWRADSPQAHEAPPDPLLGQSRTSLCSRTTPWPSA